MTVIRACEVRLGFPCEETKTLFYFICPARVVYSLWAFIFFNFLLNLMFATCGVRTRGLQIHYLSLDLILHVSDCYATGATTMRQQLATYAQKGNHWCHLLFPVLLFIIWAILNQEP